MIILSQVQFQLCHISIGDRVDMHVILNLQQTKLTFYWHNQLCEDRSVQKLVTRYILIIIYARQIKLITYSSYTTCLNYHIFELQDMFEWSHVRVTLYVWIITRSSFKICLNDHVFELQDMFEWSHIRVTRYVWMITCSNYHVFELQDMFELPRIRVTRYVWITTYSSYTLYSNYRICE